MSGGTEPAKDLADSLCFAQIGESIHTKTIEQATQLLTDINTIIETTALESQAAVKQKTLVYLQELSDGLEFDTTGLLPVLEQLQKMTSSSFGLTEMDPSSDIELPEAIVELLVEFKAACPTPSVLTPFSASASTTSLPSEGSVLNFTSAPGT